jgi:hypothetical protein
VDASSLPPEGRRDLLRYLTATSKERSRVIAELVERSLHTLRIRRSR